MKKHRKYKKDRKPGETFAVNVYVTQEEMDRLGEAYRNVAGTSVGFGPAIRGLAMLKAADILGGGK